MVFDDVYNLRVVSLSGISMSLVFYDQVVGLPQSESGAELSPMLIVCTEAFCFIF